uniref:FAF domain-containing protein n=1 Tax=Oryza punctata TaxID=4537 RepID=A0A0E0K5A9_ORYPU
MPAQRLPCRDRDSLGLRSLLVADATACGDRDRVVTRVIVAVPPQRVQETTRREEECNGGRIDNEEGDENGGDEGCWVTYGRRGRMRRLPPPLPSLRGAMRRTRTEDGRLLITEAPAGARRPEYIIRARRWGGRLTMQLVESKDFYPCPAPAGPSPAQEDDEDTVATQAAKDTSMAAAMGKGDPASYVQKAAVSPPTPSPPSIGCFEDVIKYHSIGSTSLDQIVTLRMVH